MIKKIKKKLRKYIKQELSDNFASVIRRELKMQKNQELLLLQNGRIWSKNIDVLNIKSIHDAEFKVFSQWGDDGIIQYLIKALDIKNKIFVEFGVENYLESNTRFLLFNNNWSGLVMDGNDKNIDQIKNSDYYWKYDLKAKSAFITAENINDLIQSEGLEGNIGLLHIDIDGNDFWIWEALDVVKPTIMIVEYNSVFGKEKAITVPYKSDFTRAEAHYSNLYAGASLPALYDLAKKKGYVFVGCNSAGNNAYFVEKEALKNIKPLSIKEGYVASKFRESRDQDGKLNYLSGEDRLKSLKGLSIYNIVSNKIEEL
tara:strand:+ start:3807 stop:4748 length:942 start_codon:yes stop_codon:yes gene_type:complete